MDTFLKGVLFILPAFFAIAIMAVAPFLSVYSYSMVMTFAAKIGVADHLLVLVIAFIGALWEAVLAVVIAKDLIKQ